MFRIGKSLSSDILIFGIIFQLMTMVMNKSKKVSPIAFVILALGNWVEVHEEMKKGQDRHLFTPSFFIVMNLLVAFYAL